VLDDALESVDRLESTITDLLKLARSERVSVEPVLLLPMVDDLSRLWSRELSARGRSLRVDVEPGLPPVPVTESALRHILDVLLANARDHGAGTVTVRVSHTAGGLVVEVADEGAGVAGDTDRIFARGEGTGHGIGLALARSLAEAEGARLTLAAPGPRPRFRLLLPEASAVTPAASSS
jgi:signal transduction histidine kinase